MTAMSPVETIRHLFRSAFQGGALVAPDLVLQAIELGKSFDVDLPMLLTHWESQPFHWGLPLFADNNEFLLNMLSIEQLLRIAVVFWNHSARLDGMAPCAPPPGNLGDLTTPEALAVLDRWLYEEANEVPFDGVLNSPYSEIWSALHKLRSGDRTAAVKAFKEAIRGMYRELYAMQDDESYTWDIVRSGMTALHRACVEAL